MSRRNKNAGQPNRPAQMQRRATRREINEQYKQAVRGPGSLNLTIKEKVK